MKTSTRKIAACGILSALACITFMIENLFPPLFIPGARLGISNLFVLTALILLGIKYSFAVLLVKITVGSFFTGYSSVMYSLPAGVISLAIEIFLIYVIKTSFPCASAVGSVINVTVQNTVFCLIAQAKEYLVYLPYLASIATATGLAIGLLLYITINKLPDKLFKEVAN